MAASVKEQMYDQYPIKAEWFSMPYNDKRKMSWFHYEYACRIYDHIANSSKKIIRRWSKQRNEEQIAEFCAYFSKRMEPGMYDIIEGNSSELSCKVGYVRDYCHSNSKHENSELTNLAQQAISELLDDCNECPNVCLFEPGAYCELFDRVD